MDGAGAVEATARPLELAVVLPTYNERKNIATMIDRNTR